MIIVFLLACSDKLDTSEAVMPIEVVSCAHPDSMFEAAVDVEVEDTISWSNVHFKIMQGEREWETNLQTEDQLIWWTHMQLYELDCLSDFEVEILKEEDDE